MRIWQRLSSYATTTAVNHCWESRPFNNIYNHSTQASKVGAQAYELYKATTKYEPHKVPFENYMPTKLWLDAGAIFGGGAEQYERVVLACPRKTLERALTQLADAVEGLGKAKKGI